MTALPSQPFVVKYFHINFIFKSLQTFNQHETFNGEDGTVC